MWPFRTVAGRCGSAEVCAKQPIEGSRARPSWRGALAAEICAPDLAESDGDIMMIRAMRRRQSLNGAAGPMDDEVRHSWRIGEVEVGVAAQV